MWRGAGSSTTRSSTPWSPSARLRPSGPRAEGGAGRSSLRRGSSRRPDPDSVASGLWPMASSSGASGGRPSPCRPSSSVRRNNAASGPSLVLARLGLPAIEDLLCQLTVGESRLAVKVVFQHGHALDQRLRKPHRLVDAGGEHAVSEVLLEDLDGLLRVDSTRIHERRKDALDLDARVEVLADHGKRVLQLNQPTHRQILALH